jgi:DNA-binding PadR family transcriptional regulator
VVYQAVLSGFVIAVDARRAAAPRLRPISTGDIVRRYRNQRRSPVPNESPRLAPSELQILLALVDGPMNGASIKDEVARRTAGDVVLGPGTLYTSIKRMLDDALIGEQGPGATQRERLYRITARGRSAAIAEARRLERIVADARAKRLIPRAAKSGEAT